MPNSKLLEVKGPNCKNLARVALEALTSHSRASRGAAIGPERPAAGHRTAQKRPASTWRRAQGSRTAVAQCRSASRLLVVDDLLLEVGLRVLADRADLRGLLAHVQVTAVEALPDLEAREPPHSAHNSAHSFELNSVIPVTFQPVNFIARR